MKYVKKFIKRKTLIYRTEVEYGDYTMNHVLGCSHGCLYPCYAYLLKKRFGNVESYEDWCEPALVENTLELLDNELPKYKSKIQMLHLCFTTDPFMYQYKEIQDLSLAAIKKINAAGVTCSVLTKGLLPIELAGLSRENEYGITLISTNEAFRKRMEPGSAPWKKRVAALRALHDSGCKTWVSIEPFPTPNILKQDLQKLLDEVAFVDRIIFGRMNYCHKATAYPEHKQFFNERADEVIAFCDKHGISYHIKNGTITE
ncbi:radical SAM protein [uncultured Ruminococcus sp.]|uniref:radical SAM protein n=1 Tax=uncultured Ruminococcus sp. TaxID=165186 RepID=UPI0026736E09|nr:radical SAM protein [uncultured Ruminococcus sp.]